ncbi:MAG: UvrD-helicase domain-containing protein [Desulfococcaceae bacterium]|jgi:hypothetical protein|nr:UvrD-helicase domain-containing protein [Desulfococcaceae bacterium]
MGEIKWDKKQIDVIEAAPASRLLVNAGPGTGKTAVACARVAYLIDQKGIEPNRIWLISFTRTAVREITDRIATYLNEPGNAYSVRIATLDSHAWAIHSGFDEKASISGSYDQNIERVLELIEKNDPLLDYLESLKHLIVDEAQDIVGIRSELIIAIMQKISKNCGITVFADEAQAIYCFAEDENYRENQNQSILPDKIREKFASGFVSCQLTSVYRTNSKNLLSVFTDLRQKILSTSETGINKLTDVKNRLKELSHEKNIPNIENQQFADKKSAFVLYRRRSEVLLASSFMKNRPHRIRMSGLPICIEPWIGAALSEHIDSILDEQTFFDLWAKKVEDKNLTSSSANEAWKNLVRYAGQTRKIVDMKLLRQRLGRRQPPAEFCSSEIGNAGPIIGTIHASKGREADIVHLMLPNNKIGNDTDTDEETRVIFVGATRGKLKLKVGCGYGQYTSRIESSGRVYSLNKKNNQTNAQVEIGRDGDINANSIAGKSVFRSGGMIRIYQKRLIDLANTIELLEAESDKHSNFSYILKINNKNIIGGLSNTVNRDLFNIGNIIQQKNNGKKRRPPDLIKNIYLRGVRSIILPPDSPECNNLYEPWASSGILLAPVILGYTTIYFPYCKWR